MNKIPLSSPYLTLTDKQFVLKVLDSSQLSLGPLLETFEREIARYTQTRFAVAVNSGTSALHLCIKALHIGQGDEVITSPFSFIASANCMLYESATPVFVDIDPATLNIDVNKIPQKITRKTKAILPVHIFGLPCDMPAIQTIADHYHLKIIEDACEAIGATCSTRTPNSQNQRKVGGIGNCGAFGFYPNKQMTTGEGGVIVTSDRDIASTCRSLRNQGRSDNPVWLKHEQLGYNYRLSELNCALGLAQLLKIERILTMREKVAGWYNERLKSLGDIILPGSQPYCRRSWFVYVIRLQSRFSKIDRDKILHQLQLEGIECRSYFPPIHLQPFYVNMFGYKHGDFPITEHIAECTIALPFFTGMSEEQVDRVCTVLTRAVRKIPKRTPHKTTAPQKADVQL